MQWFKQLRLATQLILAFALWFGDPRTGLLEAGRSAKSALLVDALLLGVAAVVCLGVIARRRRLRARERRR